MTRTLHTYGYQGGSVEDLQTYAAAGALIVDVRLSPRSRVPQWRGPALRAALGRRYVGLPSLGNLNYRSGGPIAIATPEEGLSDLATLAAEYPVVLLCRCPDPETCHRSTVAQMAQDAGICGEAVHLRPGDPLPAAKVRVIDQRLRMFSIYDHPRDFPDCFVVRPWRVGGGHVEPEPIVCLCDRIFPLQQGLAALGLARILPEPGDDPAILETWL